MKRIVPLLLIGLLGIGLLVVAGLAGHWYFTGRKPDQPIAYTHQVHVVGLQLDCTHCHENADKSPRATLPAMSICMECHETAAIDRPEIKKLTAYWTKKELIPWRKVNRLLWHVYFTHKRHIKAGVDCTYCHSEMKAMTTARQVRSFDMGFCVSCHRANKAPTDCLTCHK